MCEACGKLNPARECDRCAGCEECCTCNDGETKRNNVEGKSRSTYGDKSLKGGSWRDLL